MFMFADDICKESINNIRIGIRGLSLGLGSVFVCVGKRTFLCKLCSHSTVFFFFLLNILYLNFLCLTFYPQKEMWSMESLWLAKIRFF